MRETPGATQTEPHSIRRGVAVCESEVDIRDTGTLIFKYEPHAAACVVPDNVNLHRSAATVIQSVAGQLARRGDYFGLIHQAES